MERIVQGARRAIFTDAFLAADSSVGLLVGPQACGKSAVAAALARDPQVQVSLFTTATCPLFAS